MIKKRLIALVSKLLSLTTIAWAVVTVLLAHYEWRLKLKIDPSYFLFTLGILGSKIVSDRVKDKLGVSNDGQK